MTLKQLITAVIAGGVVAIVLDTIVHGFLLSNAYYSLQPGLFRSDGSPVWLLLGDVVAVVVFVWFYQRVRHSFRRGALGGAVFGFYAGVLIGFPTHIVLNLVVVDFSYALAWAWTIHEIAWTVTVGAVVGAIAGRPVPEQASLSTS